MCPGVEATIAAMNLNKNWIMIATSKYYKSISSEVHYNALQISMPHFLGYFHNFTNREDRKQVRLSVLYIWV